MSSINITLFFFPEMLTDISKMSRFVSKVSSGRAEPEPNTLARRSQLEGPVSMELDLRPGDE